MHAKVTALSHKSHSFVIDDVFESKEASRRRYRQIYGEKGYELVLDL